MKDGYYFSVYQNRYIQITYIRCDRVVIGIPCDMPDLYRLESWNLTRDEEVDPYCTYEIAELWMSENPDRYRTVKTLFLSCGFDVESDSEIDLRAYDMDYDIGVLGKMAGILNLEITKEGCNFGFKPDLLSSLKTDKDARFLSWVGLGGTYRLAVPLDFETNWNYLKR